jgi:hypothetical protein
MGILQWAAALDTAGTFVRAARKMSKGAMESLSEDQPGTPSRGALEATLAGVVVSALKEAFHRDSARLEMEQAQIEAERKRAEELLRVELRRQAAERMLGQLRLIAVIAVGTWAVSAILGAVMPGMRETLPRVLLAAGWVLSLGSLGAAFAGWQYVSIQSMDPTPSGAVTLTHASTTYAPWLLIAALALTGAALLAAF